MAEFFAMGGYGFHVWTCWGLSGILLGGLGIARERRLRRTAKLAKQHNERAKRQEPNP